MNYKLYEVFEFIRNGANIKQGIEGGYPITRIETISNGFIDKSRMGYAGISDISKFSEYVLKNGDILMSHINSETHLGKTAIYEAEDNNDIIIHGMNLLCLRPNKRILHPKYIYYYFNSNEFRKKIHKITKKSVNQSSFSVSDLKNLKVNIPDKVEQKKIADILDKAKDLITKRKAQIEALDQLTQSVFLEMFGDPVTNKTWERRLLKDIADVRDGTHDSPKYVPSGYPLVTSKNIKNGKIDLSNVNYISEEDFININKRSKVDVGDIIMPMIGTIGNPIIVDEQPNFAIKNVALIKFNNPCVINIYIKYLLDSNYLDYILNKNKRGGTQKFLSLTAIRNMEIPLPPRDLQDKFSEIVKKIDSKKSILHKSLRELEKNFNSLMQRTFKGELFND